MGSHYELKSLCGKWYIEYQSDATAWNLIAVELTYEQTNAIHDFEGRLSEQRNNFLKSIVDAKKA